MAADSALSPTASTSLQELVRGLLELAKAHPERLGALVDEAAAPVVVFDPWRKIVGANARADAFFRAGSGGLAGLGIDALVPERLRGPQVTPAPPMNGVIQIEVPSVALDGAERPTSWVVGSVGAGDELRFVLAFQDLTAAEQGLQALRRSEERFRLLIESVRDHAIILVDPEGRVVTWNPGAERIQGFTAEEIVGEPVARFFTGEDVRAGLPERLLETALRDGRSSNEGWRVRRDGGRFWAEVTYTPLFDASGRHLGFAKVTHDLTEKREAEENVRRLIEERVARGAAERAEAVAREQARRQRLLAEASRFFTSAVADPQTVFAEVARRAAELMNDTCTVLVPTDEPGLYEIKAVHWVDAHGQAASREHVGKKIPLHTISARVFETGRSSFEAVIRQAEFRAQSEPEFVPLLDRHPVHAMMSVPISAQGRVIAVATLSRHEAGRPFEPADLALVEDLAGRVGLAIENGWLYRDLQAAVRARDDLLAVVSHDLRNPLSAMLLSAGQLVYAPGALSAERIREIGRRIEKAGKRMDRLLQDLLDRARIHSGKPLSVRLAPTEVGPLLQEAGEVFQPMASSAAVNLQVEPPGAGCRVLCDADRLQQVFSNLLGNALRHTPPSGSVRLAAARRDGEVVFTVQDTGSGIAPHVLSQIFDPYWQGTGERGGLGLGLAVCKAIVEAHRGRIKVDSTPGVGTTFTVHLPGAD